MAESIEEAARGATEGQDTRGHAGTAQKERSVILSEPLYVGITNKPKGPPDAYKMTSNPRGLALIINNKTFSGAKERRGSDVDTVKIGDLFDQLHFRVIPEKDLNLDVMKRKLEDFANMPDHQESDCCVVVIMSHGYQAPDSNLDGAWRPLLGQPGSSSVPCPYVVFSSDDKELEVEWIIQTFTAIKALKGKPKLFIIQSCRGGKPQDGDGVRNFVETDSKKLRMVLDADDIFVANSTIPYQSAYRDTQEGAWFIQSICHVFAESAHCKDLKHLMEKVHNRVADHEGPKGQKQSAELWIRGRTKALYFNPGIVP
ncbi:unnamed protein product [Darwinula stevensoni]|uniref:Uncharacterized protein n=1 Tax=Darwinula stevensoni TaxID=69355 RepID=A0A7R9A7H8_9CRUS|nr:unnamed protein product [Darwinula stevensoni]CAG0891889.1 unnamed protein product [Darwinula stevensoni]